MTNQIQEQTIMGNRRYLIHKQLGQGGMGVVYQATDRLTGDIVALKQVRKLPQQAISHMPKSSLHLTLAHEFQLMAGLRHPHIISVLDYGFDMISASEGENDEGSETQPFYTMIYLSDAQTILDAAQEQPLAYQLDLIQQLLQALAYLHRRGVLHRDLKPANVLVHQETVRVLDFGLAVTREETNVFNSAGTPLYMAPELFDGEPYSPQADLFAVGVLATQMLTGEHPFAPLDYEFLDRVLDAAPNLGTMDERLHPLMHQLLAKTPDERFDNANDALLMLADTLETSTHILVETTAIRESYLQAATFVGREQEMAQLSQALEAAHRGQGSAWLIGGESGVGKSRFVREVRTQALVAGFLVLSGQVEEIQGGIYVLWREPLRHLLVTLPTVTDLDAGVLLPVVPDVAQLLGRPVKPAPSLSAEATQIRLFSTIATLFEQIQQPIMLILEDIHWADESLLVLPYLTRQIGEQSMLLLATYRDDERPQLTEQLSDMQPLHLGRLTTENMADLSAAMLGEIGEQVDILQLLQHETEGNAFFAVEVIRTLAEDMGGLQQIGQMTLPDTLLPNGIQTIVERRFAQVAEADQPLLLLAAVSGRVLDLTILLLLNQDRTISRWLTRCADAAILEVVDDRWQFRHAKLRDGLLATLSADEKQRYHQQVAEVIEQLYPDDANYAAQLMGHWRETGHPDKEYGYAYLAATHAANQYANDDALSYATRAYELASERLHDPQKQVETLLIRESLYTLIGESHKREADLALLMSLTPQMDTPALQAEVTLRQANFALLSGDFPAAETFAKTAIPYAKDAQTPQCLTRAYLLMGEALYSQADYDLAEKTLLQAQTLAEALEDHHLMGEILISLGDVVDKHAQNDQALDYYQQALHIYQAIDDAQGMGNAFYHVGWMNYLLFRCDEARAYYHQGLEISQRIGDKANQGRILNALGVLHEYEDDFATGTAYFQQALAIKEEIGDKRGVCVVLNGLGFITLGQGNHAQAYTYYLRVLQMSEELGSKDITTVALQNLGRVYRHQKGVYEQAKQYLERGIQMAYDIGWADIKGEILVLTGIIYNRVGQYHIAQSHFEEAVAVFQQLALSEWAGDALRYIGECLLAQQEFVQAQDHFQQTLAASRAMSDDERIVDALTRLGWVAYKRGDHEQMLAYYQELSTLAEKRKASYYQAESQVGIALAHMLAKHEWVEVDITPAINYIENEPNLLIPDYPFRLHLLCYHLLTLMEDPYTDTLLSIAYAQLQDLASLIEDETWRQSYRENVPEHREIIRLYTDMVES
ncbi:MAG: BREX system ATP-binding domain-containing protein [Chloroflexota bacterium]